MNDKDKNTQVPQSLKTAVMSCEGCEWQISYDRNRLCPICKDYEYNTKKHSS